MRICPCRSTPANSPSRRSPSGSSPRSPPSKSRYSFATHFLRNGGNIVNLQQILGHTTLAMSRRYAVVADSDAFAASVTLSPVAQLHRLPK
jgi:integrase